MAAVSQVTDTRSPAVGVTDYIATFPVSAKEVETVSRLANMTRMAERMRSDTLSFVDSISYVADLLGLLQGLRTPEHKLHREPYFEHAGVHSNSLLFECAYILTQLAINCYKALLFHWRAETGCNAIKCEDVDVEKRVAMTNADTAQRMLLQFIQAHAVEWSQCFRNKEGATAAMTTVYQFTSDQSMVALVHAIGALSHGVGLVELMETKKLPPIELMKFATEATGSILRAQELAARHAPSLIKMLCMEAVAVEMHRWMYKAMALHFEQDGNEPVQYWCARKPGVTPAADLKVMAAEMQAKGVPALQLDLRPPHVTSLMTAYMSGAAYPSMTKYLLQNVRKVAWPKFVLA